MRKSIDWKLGIFGVIALILTLGLSAVDAVAVLNGTVTSGSPAKAGDTDHAITIRVNVTAGRTFTLAAPDGWPQMRAQNAATLAQSYVDVEGGSIVAYASPVSNEIRIETTGTGTVAVTISYLRVKVPNAVGRDFFTIATTTPAETDDILIEVTADGSGSITLDQEGPYVPRNVLDVGVLSDAPDTFDVGPIVADKVIKVPGGVTVETFTFTYTAAGVLSGTAPDLISSNPNILDGGELQLEIPARWPRPVVGSNIEVVSDLGGTNADPTLGVIGGVRVTGPRSGPWHIIIPITDMDGGQMIRILYKDVLVPYRTQFEPGYDFPLRVKGSGSGARLRQVDVEADDTGRPNSGNIEIDVTDARPGSGIMEVTSGGVAAGSEDNTLTFVYTAAGTLSGGALELVPPDGWTTPQGTRGAPGYTTATPSSAVEGINFAENRGAGRPGFSEGSINILFRTMRAGNTITITYSEVTVPVDAVSTEFDVYVGPDFSEVGIGSGSGFDTAKFDRSKAPIVYVQAGHGSGIVTIEEDVDNDGVADGDSDQIVHAGEELALIFTFTADGDMDGGQFIMNVDSSWPQPTRANTIVTSSGTTDEVSIRSQRREIIVTLESLSANQTITVRYGGGEKISAPGIPQISEFSFESTSTEGGVPAGINPPDDSPDIFKVEVIQAADGSGKVTLAESQRTVFAGSFWNDFSITYEAVGVIDSGQIEFTVPDTWTPFKDTDDTVYLTTTAAGISLSDEELDVNDRTITYDISTSRAGGTVTFRYTNVTVQPVIADAASDGIDNDGDGLTDGGDTDETGAGQVLLDVKVKGDDESGRNLESVTDTEAKITIDNTADGGGLAEITIAEAGTATSLPKNEDGVYDDVYAGHNVDITIVYTADGTMSSALDDNLGIATEGSDLDLARKGLTSLELTIPSAFTRPDYGTDTDADGHLTVTHSRGSARPTPQFKPFGYSPKITNVVLARDETLTITFKNVTTPAALGSHDFIVRSQGRAAVDGDGRSLKPLTAGYPRVTIGSVKSGVGDAYVHSINGTVIVADDRAKLDKKKILGGQEGVTIEFVFKATGAFDGEVRFDAPSGWNEPGGESGVPGYTQAKFAPTPSSGASIASTTEWRYERVNQAIIIPVKMGKDDQLVIAYGANGGNSGLRVPEVNSARAYNFDIETKRKGDTSFADVPKARNNAVDLQIQATPIDGSGTVNVDTDVVINTTDNNERKRDLVFTYRADGEIGSVRLERPTPWPQFQHPENTGTDVDNNGGKVSISGDRQGTSNLGAGATSSSVRFDFSPKLTEGQSVRIRYQNVRIPTAAAEYQFKFFSGTAVGGQGLLVRDVSVIVVSEDGSGKVSSTVRDTGEQSNNELVIENVRRAGMETTLVFYYNLDDSGADEKEYIRNGRLRITAPSEWALLQKDQAVEQRDTADLKIADIEARKDNKPVLEISGSDIIVTIPEQKNREYIKITVKANTPTRRDKSQFTVESQTSQAGTLTGIRKNTVSSPVVIVDVVDADDGTGTVTSNIPATVPSGSRDNVFVITYTASAELSTRKADGDLATATEIGGKPRVVSDGSDFSGVSSNIEVAGIQLRIPNTWAPPNFADTEENPGSSANVRVNGPGSAFFDFDPTRGGYDEDLVIDNVTGFHTISVPIKQLEAGESITLTYGAGTDKAEAQPGTGDKVGIYILSKGGVSGDTFTNVKKSGPLAEDGKFQFNVGPAGDGTGTATAMVTENGEDSSVVHGGDSGIEIEFTYTATGVIQGGAIQLQVPEGWEPPQGLPGRPGYTRQKTTDTLRLGLPVYDDAARTVTFTTGAADLTSTSGNVTIVYGDRSGTTATPENNGAYSPKVGATGDKAGKFLVRMRGISQFATVAELPIDVTNAKDGTGRFEISPANTRAGQHGTYMVKYTAEGPLKDGAVRLVIPENWGYGNGTDEVLPDKDNLKVSTVGGKLGKPTYPVETATGARARTVIANIEALNGDETVTFTLVTKAQPNGTRDPGIKAGFTVASTREPSTVSNPRSESDFVQLILKTRGGVADRVKDITVRQAADGSGSFVALDGSNEVVNIIKFGGKPGTINFKFTPEGTMEADGLIELDIPAGWTDAVAGAIGDTDAGKIFLDNGDGGAPTGVVLKEVVDKRKVVVNIVSPGLRVNADDDDEFFIVYVSPTAPTPSAGQDYPFTARSRSTHDDHADLQPLPEPKYPTIFVSRPGIGSGAMQVYNYPRDSATRNLDPDKRTVVEDVRAADGVTLTFVYTAADDIQGGELRVTIPSEWSEAEDNIFNAHPSETESRRRNKVTFRTLGTALDAAEHNNDVNVEAFADDSRLIIIPIPSLSARDQVIFQYKGKVQNTADEAGVPFETKTRHENVGTPSAIARSPAPKVQNVESGTGTVTVTTNPPDIAAGTPGNEITFNFKAEGTMDGGEVSMEVPADWSPPQLDERVAGYVKVEGANGGSVAQPPSISDRDDDGVDDTVTVSITTLGPDQIVRIIYGYRGGNAGVETPADADDVDFRFWSNGGESGDELKSIRRPATVIVTNARDGSGTITMEPKTVSAGQVQEFVFTYTAQGTVEEGKVQLTAPHGWPAPTDDSTKEGYTTARIVSDVDAEDVGTVTLSFNEAARSVTAEISFLSAVGQTLVIRYGDSEGEMAGVTVPAGVAGTVFGVRTQGSSDPEGGLRELRSARPRVTVTAPDDGFGTATVTGDSDGHNAGSTGNTVEIEFEANADVDGGSVSVEIPMDWTPPEGHVEVAPTGIGEVTYSDQMVIVDNVTLTAGDTIIFTYSDATAQGTAESATFIVKSKGSADGIFTELGASAATDDSETPNIDESESPYRSDWMVDVVNAADGTGTLVANPDIVVAGGTIELIELTYMPVGTMDEGVLRVTVPSSWTPPSNDLDAPGYVSAVAEGGGSVSPAEADAATGEISVFITTLPPEGTIVISYKNVTAPAEPEESEFMAQSNGGGVSSSSEDLMAGPATIKVRLSADSLAITSDLQTVFTDQVSDAITIGIQEGDEAAVATVEVTVTLMSSSDAGMFDTAMDGAFDGTVTSVTIPAGKTSVDVYYKDGVAGTATLTATATPGETEQMATQDITITAGATALALETDQKLFASGTLEIAVTLWGADGNASELGADLEVMLASDSETGAFMGADGNSITSVMIPAGENAATFTYTDSMVTAEGESVTLTATAEGLTDGPLEVMVHGILAEVMVDPMPTVVKVGDDVIVTVTAKPGLMPPPSFTVGDIVVAPGIAMTESPDGTYTGMFTVVADTHGDGMYDVTVTVGEGEDVVTKTVENGVTIDNTPPMITSGHDAPISAQNGDTVMLMVSSEEAGLTVMGTMGTGDQAVDTMAESDSIIFMESADTAGMYKAEFMISAENDADNGMYMISVTAVDAVGNTSAAVSISIHLQNGSEFELTVPEGLSLIHIPLKVTSVDGENQMLEKISDLYDALGEDNVNFLITRNVEAGKWATFLNAGDEDKDVDREITADLGILAEMNNEVTRMLRGEAWGENGVSMISLKAGLNLVGIPLDSAELNMVSHLLSDDVKVIIVSDEGVFKSVTAPTSPANGPIEGGRSYIVTAAQNVTIEVTGEAWSSMPSTGITASPVAIPSIAAVDGVTPVLAIRGSVIGESRGVAQVDLRITVRNLSTGATVSVVSGGEGDAGQYDVTFVDTKAAHAAQVGDVLEIKAESPNPLVGVQPLRHIISVDDVKNSRIQLAELVTYEIPAKTELLLNYPNPFNPETWIPFRLAEDSQVSLTIYDRTGRVVRSLELGHRPASVYETRAKAIYWDGRNDFGERVASGMYFYTLTAKDFSATRRMVILK